LGRKNKETEG